MWGQGHTGRIPQNGSQLNPHTYHHRHYQHRLCLYGNAPHSVRLVSVAPKFRRSCGLKLTQNDPSAAWLRVWCVCWWEAAASALALPSPDRFGKMTVSNTEKRSSVWNQFVFLFIFIIMHDDELHTPLVISGQGHKARLKCQTRSLLFQASHLLIPGNLTKLDTYASAASVIMIYKLARIRKNNDVAVH